MTALLSLARLESAPEENRRLGSLLGLSLAAHVAIFLLATSMQWSPKLRPLSSQDVTLVSLATAPARAAAPKSTLPVTPPQPKREAPPAPMKAVEPPPPPVRAAPAGESVPPPAPAKAAPATEAVPPPAPVRKSTLKDLLGQELPAPPPASTATAPEPDGLVRDLKRGMELPPEPPKLGGEEVPASTAPSKTAKIFESSVKNLSVPNAPKAVEPPSAPAPTATTKPATPQTPLPSLKSLMTEELKKRVPAPQAAPPVVAAKPPSVDVQKPAMEIRSQSAAPGQSRYLALVQHRISQFWTPTDVQAGSQSLRVRIKFRLASTGVVSNVAVEQSSGVYYYDQAGQRAVLSAVPLPPFPPDLKEAWLDVHISFTVGEGAG